MQKFNDCHYIYNHVTKFEMQKEWILSLQSKLIGDAKGMIWIPGDAKVLQ